MTHPRHALLIACALTLALQAAEPAKAPEGKGPDAKGVIADSAVRQAQLNRAFETFRQKLAVLAGRLEVSMDEKDKDRAKAIRKALALAGERGTDGKFEALLRSLGTKGAAVDIDVLGKASREVQELRDDLKKILALLNDDGRDAALKQRQQELKELLERLKALKANQERLMARTEMKKGENKDLMKNQEGLKKETNAIGKQEKTPDKAKTPLKKAEGKMGKASEKLAKNDNPGAGESQAGAISDIDEAIAAVEEELNQTEQEQRERKLRDLLARVKRMHAYQKEILASIVDIGTDLAKTSDGKPTLAHAAKANKTADVQLTSLREADGALKLLKDDATGLAFIEVLEQVALDMDILKRRLDTVDVGPVTKKVGEDVVDTLAEMIKALEKAIQENKAGGGGGGGKGGKDPPLVTLLQQLKMIFAMQRRVNSRTELYSKHYTGEQAPTVEAVDAKEKARIENVRKELGDLSKRQERIGQVTREIGKQNERGVD